MLREENENLSHIRKRETILSKKENIELRASDKAKEESIPNTATKKLNRTHELERGTNKLRTLATESSTGPSNKAFKNIPGDKTSGVYFREDTFNEHLPHQSLEKKKKVILRGCEGRMVLPSAATSDTTGRWKRATE